MNVFDFSVVILCLLSLPVYFYVPDSDFILTVILLIRFAAQLLRIVIVYKHHKNRSAYLETIKKDLVDFTPFADAISIDIAQGKLDDQSFNAKHGLSLPAENVISSSSLVINSNITPVMSCNYVQNIDGYQKDIDINSDGYHKHQKRNCNKRKNEIEEINDNSSLMGSMNYNCNHVSNEDVSFNDVQDIHYGTNGSLRSISS